MPGGVTVKVARRPTATLPRRAPRARAACGQGTGSCSEARPAGTGPGGSVNPIGLGGT